MFGLKGGKINFIKLQIIFASVEPLPEASYCSNNYMSLRYGSMSDSKKKKKKKGGGGGGGRGKGDEDFIFKSRSLRGMFIFVLYGHI